MPGAWAVSSQDVQLPNDVVLIPVMPSGTSADMWSAFFFMTDGLGAPLVTGILALYGYIRQY